MFWTLRASSRDQLTISAILKLALTHITCLKITWQTFGKRLHFSVWVDRELAGSLMGVTWSFQHSMVFSLAWGWQRVPAKWYSGVSSLWSGLHSVSITMEKRDAIRTTFFHSMPRLYSQPLLGREGEGLARKKHQLNSIRLRPKNIDK